MVPELRERFNAEFSPAQYARAVHSLESSVNTTMGYRICETPIFVPRTLMFEMEQASRELLVQLRTPEYFRASSATIPAEHNAPHEGSHPHFVLIDFAIVRGPDMRLAPRLIELQALPGPHALLLLMSREYQRMFAMDGMSYLLNDLTDEGYLALLKEVLLNGHDPQEVLLVDVDPFHQPTLADFRATENLVGLAFADVAQLIKRNGSLYYRTSGGDLRIARLYNRIIMDEFARRRTEAAFAFTDELNVEWVGHPNWSYRISKFSLPFLDHWTVPPSWFLDQLETYPRDLTRFVLKPLFSHAGRGVNVDLSRAVLDSIATSDRGRYLLQEKVAYAPVLETPDGARKVEIRIMMIWPDRAPEPIAAATMARVSRGPIMNICFNLNQTWSGASCCFF